VENKLVGSFSQRERKFGLCDSFNISGHSDDVSGSAHVSCSSLSVSSRMESYRDIVPQNDTANAGKPSPEQSIYCCSSQASMSPSSSLPPEESTDSYKNGKYIFLTLFFKILSQ
jgi:hypothetical protein